MRYDSANSRICGARAWRTFRRILFPLMRPGFIAGYRKLMTLAEKISDSEWRASFLENIPEHRAMVELWERLPAERS